MKLPPMRVKQLIELIKNDETGNAKKVKTDDDLGKLLNTDKNGIQGMKRNGAGQFRIDELKRLFPQFKDFIDGVDVSENIFTDLQKMMDAAIDHIDIIKTQNRKLKAKTRQQEEEIESLKQKVKN